ncbi:ABC transporter permease subunit [Rhodobacter sphaeroides]|jgi:ABC-type dipeptide/oligopeptide/nickel transport systems, permease components|uniref:ABC di/oligopeptide transporter, inner membrane subunit n=1 Tax=Cereibacter sphaeroides (strain ATCC 17023 / DSM 158 / JCM 6121 / CCUG 31486 / LMG 2827 / NBRC 12203 / NCIMB 8253 / ATH 2.4.1.) TaxID=272943 RepID=Q3HKJ8_CERS4|nr:ABC transporter permease [Cereibacter sphaeroides]ABA81746.1 ABC di/oligopeptide transporter, inner membrane subunit [Cereibacter sphaeroides 2.4.1]AXC63757.1 ABC transporter permease [Cereibacter sphaeroides 2.4.1]MVX49968.1 ABC transporter permease subunit [Cereibacter sphaeroides]MVX50076.1 ABC transporter permease subunit [Cereibacter sphaeroides]QHA15276.1 ABC transporter permease subunit [Cereibacter sphaeroides]
MTVLRFLIRRMVSAVPVLFVVSLVTFAIIAIVPGDVTAELAGAEATAEQRAVIRDQLGLNQPLYQQALRWYGNLLQGDLGHSYLLNMSVTDAVLERLPVTLSLAGLALVLAVVLGVLLGVLAAIRHDSWVDQGTMSVALIGLSVPDFWLGLIMISVFSVGLAWFPTGGYVPFSEDALGWARSMALPSLALAFTQMGVIARMTRSSMLEVMGQDYIRTARAKGMRRHTVVFKHALRNALVPVITVIGVMTGVLLGGAVVIESVFSLPGVGRLIIGAIQRRDFPIIQGGLLITASLFVFVNILVDLAYGWFDPRVRNDR